MDSLKGQIDHITFYSEDNNYAVIKLKEDTTDKLVTVVGTVPSPTPGAILSMMGTWVTHHQFGLQFKIETCKVTVPETVVGIQKYLGGGLIKGIGPAMSKRIVSVFGKDTLDIIENDPTRLLEIDGIGAHRLEVILQAWNEQKEIRSVMMFLQSAGVSSTYAEKIYKRYGNDAIAIVKANPYRLAHDIWGIGFLTADKIAQNLGFEQNSQERAVAGIMYTLEKMGENGHVFYPYDYLMNRAQEMLAVDYDILVEAMENLKNSGQLYFEALQKDGEKFTAIYFSRNHFMEVRIAELLNKINRTKTDLKTLYPDSSIKYIQQKECIHLAEKQIEAIKSALTNKVTIITGGPGTGKTTITKVIIELMSLITDKILLAAPTGRAAKRMSEATRREAKTIHRLLEFNPISGTFNLDESNPLDCDVIIIDESSMIDNALAYYLLRAIPQYAIVIFIGDTNQLPSVAAGNVLNDIINSGVFPVVELNEIFRQAKTSEIVINAHKIINGEYPKIENRKDGDFFFIEENSVERTLQKTIAVVKNRIENLGGDMNNVQVLSPMNKGNLGTIALNAALQDALNTNRTEITRGGIRYRLGDKVMQIRNNYDKEMYNGDIGSISEIDPENQTVTVMFDNIPKVYEYSELEELVLAYAVTIHKSQGSEYPVVVMPLAMSHFVMLQRNLLYTGVTRGKKMVVIIGSSSAIKTAVQNNQVTERYTWLEQRIRGINDSPV